MYFIPNNSWLFHYGVKISPHKRYITTAFVMVLLVIGWYFCVFKLCSGIQKSYEKSISQLNMQIDTQHTLQKEYAMHEHNCLEYKQNLKKLFKEQKSFDAYMAIIFDGIQKHHLMLQSYAPLANIKKSWYYKIPTSYVIDGTFNNIVLFLETLVRCPLLGSISMCSIQKLQNDRLRFSFFWNTIMIDEHSYE